MNTSVNKYDAIESLIFNEGLRIQAIDIHQDLDLLLVILNTNAILRQKLSAFKRLIKATEAQLHNYQFIGEGTGVYWPDIDEDLSLKGFLQNELRSLVVNEKNSKAA
jgi:hypothetical protein